MHSKQLGANINILVRTHSFVYAYSTKNSTLKRIYNYNNRFKWTRLLHFGEVCLSVVWSLHTQAASIDCRIVCNNLFVIELFDEWKFMAQINRWIRKQTTHTECTTTTTNINNSNSKKNENGKSHYILPSGTFALPLSLSLSTASKYIWNKWYRWGREE